jgi:DNA-binding transcriptional LysR family regulator
MLPARDWDDHRLGRFLKLRDLTVLRTVARCGSMGKAAAQLSVSQPAISKTIAEMEKTLGVRLLDRAPQGVTPTVFAETLLERGAIAFDELRQAIRDIEHLADPTAGELRIGCSAVLAEGFVATVINQVSQLYPRIIFHLSAQESGAIYLAVEHRQVDLAVARLFKPVVDRHLAAEILYDERHIVAAGARNPWARRRGIQLGDLMDEQWVLPPPDSLTGAIVQEAFDAVGLPVPRATIVTSSTPARGAFVASGKFLSILPGSMLALPGNGPVLKALPLKLETHTRPIGIVTLKNRTISPVAQLFISWARNLAFDRPSTPLADDLPAPAPLMGLRSKLRQPP